MENLENNSILAAGDIGSNTVRMLIAACKEGKIRPLEHLYAVTCLGQGLSKGILLEENIEATIQVLEDFKRALELYQPAKIRLVATSAVREASNSRHFLARAAAATGLGIDVLSSQEEAALSYLGATKNKETNSKLKTQNSKLGLQSKPIVLDVGGGSSELIWQEENRFQSLSFPVGAVRAAAAAWDHREIAKRISLLPPPAGRQLIGLGGTITTAAGVLLGLNSYNREAVDGQVLSYGALEGLEQELSALSRKERCLYSPLLAKRGENIAEGLQIILIIMKQILAPALQVSVSGILDGIVWQLSIDN